MNSFFAMRRKQNLKYLVIYWENRDIRGTTSTSMYGYPILTAK